MDTVDLAKELRYWAKFQENDKASKILFKAAATLEDQLVEIGQLNDRLNESEDFLNQKV